MLVAVFSPRDRTGAFFGFAPSADYTVNNWCRLRLFQIPNSCPATPLPLMFAPKMVPDMAGWQFDIDFNPEVLQAVEVSEGDFLKSDGGATFFRRGGVDNTNGKITGFSAARTTTGGASGSGSLLQVTFKARSDGETRLALQNLRFGSRHRRRDSRRSPRNPIHGAETTPHGGCQSRWICRYPGPYSRGAAVGEKRSRGTPRWISTAMGLSTFST